LNNDGNGAAEGGTGRVEARVIAKWAAADMAMFWRGIVRLSLAVRYELPRVDSVMEFDEMGFMRLRPSI
jgi:hypothetical protein